MTSSQSRIGLPQVGIAILLGVVLLIANIAGALYSVLHIQQSPFFLLLSSFLIGGTLAFWAHIDSQSTDVSMGLDQALYIFLAWPITFPLYIIMTRGFRKGSLLLIFFIGLYILTLIPAILVMIVVTTGRIFQSTG
jgi:hypothetical protein